jgi:5-methylcytosine-specific restriction enzyme subunit McrC
VTGDHWAPEAARFTIREYGTASAPPELVDSVEDALWPRVRLTAGRRAGERDWTVSAEQHVGVARLRVGARDVPLSIRPKLAVDVFFLADYAFGGGSDRNVLVDRRLQADLAAIRTDPAACLIAWLLADVERFARRHLRRTYLLRREVLEGELRERLLLDDYVSGHLGQGLPQEVPCEFPDLSVDTPANRAIRATVRYALTQVPLLELEAARIALRKRARRTLALFAAVSDERLHARTFRDLRRHGHPRHYAPILDRCEAFASGMHLEREIGDTTRQAFLWDMNVLFQEAIRGILDLWPAGALDTTRPRATIRSPAGERLSSAKVDPDYVLRGSWGTLLLDAKYKDTGLSADTQEIAVPGAGRVRVSRADVYQAVAYRQHDAYPQAASGLVFPVALVPGQPLPKPRTVTGFGEPIHLLFVDVGAAASINLGGLYEHLAELVGLDVDFQVAAAAA